MNKIFSFFAASNRYKHFIGGFIVATLAGSFYAAVYAAIVVELKDHLYGNSRDWTDWLCTLLSGIYVFKWWVALCQFNMVKVRDFCI